MNLDEIIYELAKEYEFDKNALKNLLNKKAVNLYDLKINDEIWLIDKNTIIKKIVYRWGIDINEVNEYVKNGNGFLTKQEAKIELQKRQVESELKKYAFQPNWKDSKQTKWTIYYWNEYNEIGFTDWRKCQYGFISFESQEIAELAVKEAGEERVKAYLKGELYE